jgi:hypothetical protein
MSWACAIPKELYIQPLPLIVLTGLDVKHQTIHREIWEGFSVKSNQKYRYLLLDGDHEYPKMKPKVIQILTNFYFSNFYFINSIINSASNRV